MMCGTPVIAFNRGSMAELIIDGSTGYLVSDISEATAAAGKLDQINPQVCRDHAVARFGVDRMIQEYIDVYTQILEDC
jgi:glycosyltransferase involved in cell wall biosynthesis